MSLEESHILKHQVIAHLFLCKRKRTTTSVFVKELELNWGGERDRNFKTC